MLPRKKKRKWTDLRIEKFLDPIKDEIDTLDQIPDGSREIAARDLVAYIELHHLQGAGR